MANGYLHAAYESTPGNEANSPTLSTKVLYTPLLSFSPSLNPAPLDRSDELRNVDEPISLIPEAFSPEWSLSTRAYPDVVGFWLKSILGAPTTTAGNGVITDPDGTVIPTGAYRHVWTAPYGPSGVNPLTTQLQAAYSDESIYFKLKGAATQSLSIDSPETGGVQLGASGPANYMSRVSSPGLTATYESLTIPPFERSQLTISTWLSGTATTEDFSLNISNPVVPVRSLGTASQFPDVMEKGDASITVSGSIPKRHIDVEDFDALLASTGFATKVKWISTVAIASSYKYSLWNENNNCQLVDGSPNALENKRVIGADYTWRATYSGTAGSSKFTLVNATTSYA